jgi:DMSO/TMAO reductase YedYZ molybdopterin-dependent catalytic subunit
MRLKTASWVLFGLVGLLPAAGCGGKDSGAAGSTPGAVKVDGALGEQRTWTVDQLATLPLQTQDVTFLTEAGASKSLQAKGVALLDLLQRAKPRFDAKTKRDAIRYAVLVHAVDNYKAVISWAEIDPDFGAKSVLVDVEENGKKLDRPNVVVPGDKEGGRHVDAVDRISLVEVKAS